MIVTDGKIVSATEKELYSYYLNFEALGHTEYVTPYLICKQCADEAKREAEHE